MEHIIRCVIIIPYFRHFYAERTAPFTYSFGHPDSHLRTVTGYDQILIAFNIRHLHFISVITREVNGRSTIEVLTHNSDEISRLG